MIQHFFLYQNNILSIGTEITSFVSFINGDMITTHNCYVYLNNIASILKYTYLRNKPRMVLIDFLFCFVLKIILYT